MTKKQQRGFTLLEVLIAMSVLAVGASSLLAIFVTAISWQTDRIQNNRTQKLYEHARQHAQKLLDEFDPRSLPKGQQRTVPLPADVDLNDPISEKSRDSYVQDAYRKFRGYKYRIDFAPNPQAQAGSSVIANVQVFLLSGKPDRPSPLTFFLNRTRTPWSEYLKSPSLEAARRARADRGR